MKQYLFGVLGTLMIACSVVAQIPDSLEPIRSPNDLAEKYSEFQRTYIAIIPPSLNEMFLQPTGRLLPFELSGFKKRFLKNLIGTQHPISGAPIYTIYAMEDALDQCVNIYAQDLTLLARVERPAWYDPTTWVTEQYGASISLDLLKLYDPARMIAEFQLIPVEYYEDHLAALEEQSSLEAMVFPMMMTMSVPVENPNVLAKMQADTNGTIEMTLTLPSTFGNYVEIFSKDNLVWSPKWQVSKGWLPSFGNSEVQWKDPDSGNKNFRAYMISDAEQDDDGDGFSNNREIYITETSPTNFNTVDEDNDGLHDWLEWKFFGDLDETPSSDADSDGLLNNEELVLSAGPSVPALMLSDPSLYDTDNDGMDDHFETDTWFLDPLDKTDGQEDYDNDGLNNAYEYSIGTYLYDSDTDDDGLKDEEILFGLNPLNANPSEMIPDSDSDGMTNGYEVANDLNPFNAIDQNIDSDGGWPG